MEEWTAQIDNITEHFLACFGSLSVEQLNWKPNSQTWSIAQNIDHLIVVNESYYPVLASLKEGTFKTPLMARSAFMATFFGKIIRNGVNPDRKKKMKTFSVWKPTVSPAKDDILIKFEKHQNELKRQIEASKEFVEKGTIISSPVNKFIVYKLETAFDIIVSHEQRHLEQAKEVLQLLTTSTSR